MLFTLFWKIWRKFKNKFLKVIQIQSTVFATHLDEENAALLELIMSEIMAIQLGANFFFFWYWYLRFIAIFGHFIYALITNEHRFPPKYFTWRYYLSYTTQTSNISVRNRYLLLAGIEDNWYYFFSGTLSIETYI